MKVRTSTIRIFITSVIALTACSCATTATKVNGRLVSSNEKRTINQAQGLYTAFGALIGAGSGYVEAQINNRSDEDTANSMIIGAIFGGRIGNGVGNQIGIQAVQQKRMVQEEKRLLDTLIVQARSYNSKVADYNSRLRNSIRGLERENLSDPAVRSVVAKRASAERNYAQKTINELDSTIKAREADSDRVKAGRYRDSYYRERIALGEQKRSLEESVNRLKRIEARASS
jgi:hypothetical protein